MGKDRGDCAKIIACLECTTWFCPASVLGWNTRVCCLDCDECNLLIIFIYEKRLCFKMAMKCLQLDLGSSGRKPCAGPCSAARAVAGWRGSSPATGPDPGPWQHDSRFILSIVRRVRITCPALAGSKSILPSFTGHIKIDELLNSVALQNRNKSVHK